MTYPFGGGHTTFKHAEAPIWQTADVSKLCGGLSVMKRVSRHTLLAHPESIFLEKAGKSQHLKM